MLLIQGASAEQIATVSFGEERPAELGSDEDAYAQNRRVEIKYTN
jgi:peptidoglycan-associated lipoprotein